MKPVNNKSLQASDEERKSINCFKRSISALWKDACQIILILIIISSPKPAKAEIQSYNVVTDEFYGINAERILLVSDRDEADHMVLMTGKCKSRAPTELYLESDPVNAKEKWFVVIAEDEFKADLQICLTGNLPAWFEKVSQAN